MLHKVGRLVMAVVATAALALATVLMAGGSASAQNRAVVSAPAHITAKPPPCTRCCLKMNKKTHRCAKYGYKKGKGKCSPKCK